MTRMRIRTGAAIAIALAAAACGGGGGQAADPHSRAVSRADYGGRWPLTVERGTLSCAGGAIVFTAPDGTAYGVNGLAADYKEIGPIWAADPSGISPKMDIGPLIQDGQKLC